MKKIILIGLTLLGLAILGYYQYGLFTDINYFKARSDISNGKIQILTYGLPYLPDSLVNLVASKYGFQYKIVAGCEVHPRLINQVDSYNSAVESYLDKLNGYGWLDKFTKELDDMYLKGN
ncbi:MAG: hypothetical protein ACJA08_000744 [Cyclobacteriaceae bacterium]|jgi:hypothetical protein